jgi:hypothetical protein
VSGTRSITRAPEYIPPQWDGPARRQAVRRSAAHASQYAGARVPGWIREFVACDPPRILRRMRMGRRSAPQNPIGPSRVRHQLRSRAWKRRSSGRDATSVTSRSCFVRCRPWRSRAPANRDIAHAACKLGLPGRLARRWNSEGLDLTAAGLRRDAVEALRWGGTSGVAAPKKYASAPSSSNPVISHSGPVSCPPRFSL